MKKIVDSEELREHIENLLYENDFNSYSEFEVCVYDDLDYDNGTKRVSINVIDNCSVREHLFLNEMMEELGYELEREIDNNGGGFYITDEFDSSTSVDFYSSKHIYIRS